MKLPSLRELPSPFLDGYGIIKVLDPPSVSLLDIWKALQAGTYSRPFILEDGPLRSLHFSLHYIQSTMRIDAPLALELAYTRAMMAFLLLVPQPRTVFMGGLGGGSLVRFIHHHLPGAALTVVENSADVIALAPEFGLPPESERFRLLESDALGEVADLRPVDVLMLDIFDRQGLVAGLASIPFFEEARRALSPEGVLVMNLTGEKPAWQSVLEQAQAVFGPEMLILTVEEGMNYVVLARAGGRKPIPWRQMEREAPALAARYGLEFQAFARELEKAHRQQLLAHLLG